MNWSIGGLLARRSTDPTRPGGRPASDHPYIKHASAVLTLDTYADLFPDDLEQVSAALDEARGQAMKSIADQLRTGVEPGSDLNDELGPADCDNTCRGGGIRTHDLFVPNEARYQAAPHPA